MAKPAGWQSSDRERSARAVARMTDPQALARVAREAVCEEARYVAVTKLDPRQVQTLLADLARNDEHLIVRLAVVERLTDMLLLTDVARYAKDPTVRAAARKRLIDLGHTHNDPT
jgi:hypothetical protein